MNLHELRRSKKPPVNEGCDNASVPRIAERWHAESSRSTGLRTGLPRKATALRYLADTPGNTERPSDPPLGVTAPGTSDSLD